MRGLYAIVDVGILAARKIDPVRFAEAAIAARPAVVQVRAKNVGAREVLALLRAIAPLCHRARIPLVANDRADLAAFAGCDMVHVGQDDISIDLVRRIAPGLGVGISTHTRAQLATALAARPRYVAYGPVFPTDSKPDAFPPVGVEALREAAAIAASVGVPLVAVGGITIERAAEVAPYVDMVAVIGALIPPAGEASISFADVSRRGTAIHDLFVRPASSGGAHEAIA